MRSFVTPVIRATLPSSTEKRTTTPGAQFLAQGIDHLAKGVAVKTAHFGGQDADVFDGFGLFEQGIGSGAGGFAFEGFELLFELFGGLELALEGGDYVVFAGVQEL